MTTNAAFMLSEEMCLVTPFTSIVCGSTGAGKTTFIKRLLSCMNDVCDRPTSDVYFFYKEYQHGYEELENVNLIQGQPTMQWCSETFKDRIGMNIVKDIANPTPVVTVVVDDQGREIREDAIQLFTVASHHYDLNLLWVTHTLYGSPSHRVVSLNTKYLFIFKNPRDKMEITSLARQVDPGKSKVFLNIFSEATSKPHSYLLADFDQNMPDPYRFRSNILFEHGEPMRIFYREQ